MYLGAYALYKDRSQDPSYHASNKNSLIVLQYFQQLRDVIFIRPLDCEFVYTTTSIVKFCDMTEEEYTIYKRDNRINTIIQ